MLNQELNHKMSIAELKEQIVELSAGERLKLAAFLEELEEKDDPLFRQTLIQRMKAMDNGNKVSMEVFEQLHQNLKNKGR
jgi:hypothetical protein